MGGLLQGNRGSRGVEILDGVRKGENSDESLCGGAGVKRG